MNVLFVFFKKIWLKIGKKNVLSRIKRCCQKKIYIVLKTIKKKFLWKMLVWIKDDRDNVTRWENLQKRWGLRLDRCFLFCRFSSKFHRVYFDNKAWLIRHLWAWHIIPYFLYHACIHHTKHQVKYLMLNLFPKVKKYGRPMGSSNRCHRKHSRRDKWTTGQTDKFARRPYQDRGSASSRPITFAKSTGPSTIHSDYELSAT